ncbi:MAG: hypothetical protein SVJ22_01710 [Halobacteriota archaeon]|nr:hypothetical protein [Halobacteriota archaeon]
MARIRSPEIPGIEWILADEDFIKVDDSCTCCGDCVRVCVARAFELKGDKARVKTLENCFECAACWFICSEDAIEITWPPGGRGFRSEFG